MFAFHSCRVIGCQEQHATHKCRNCGDTNSAHFSRNCPLIQGVVALQMGCKVVGCNAHHPTHFCKRCGNKDSTHRSRHCPMVRCKAVGCNEQHATHLCKHCGNPDSTHKSSNCPVVQGAVAHRDWKGAGIVVAYFDGHQWVVVLGKEKGGRRKGFYCHGNGSREHRDKTPEATALREFVEEFGNTGHLIAAGCIKVSAVPVMIGKTPNFFGICDRPFVPSATTEMDNFAVFSLDDLVKVAFMNPVARPHQFATISHYTLDVIKELKIAGKLP